MQNKKQYVIKQFLAGILACVSLVSMGCKEKDESFYVLPDDTFIEAGITYSPDFKLKDGATATVTELKKPATSQTELNGLSFTPDTTGEYKYTVRFEKNGKTALETIVYTARDTVAPEIVSTPTGKQAELGFYGALQADLEEIQVSDACAKSFNKYFNGMVYDGTVTQIDKNAQSVFFAREGEYTMLFSVEDYSGNKTDGSYTLTVSDTQAPVIDLPTFCLAWAENGKVALPAPNIIEMSGYTLTTTAKDSQNNPVTVKDGYIMTSQTGVYTLEYIATDAKGNVSPAFTTTLCVKERGVINDFALANEAILWGDLPRGENGKMRLQSEQDGLSIQFSEYFNLRDWSSFNTLQLALENERGASLSVSTQILKDGVWLETARENIASAKLNQTDLVTVTPTAETVRIALADYNVTGAEGLRLQFACQGGVQLSVDDIRLTNETTMQEQPTQTSGLAGGKYVLGGKEFCDVAFAGVTASEQNAVTYKIWSNVDAEVNITLVFDGAEITSRHSLCKGYNEFTRLPEKESEGGLANSLSGVKIKNLENYPIMVYLDEMAFAKVSALALEDLVQTGKEYFISYGESFEVPYPFTVDERYISDVAVTLTGAGEPMSVKIGEKLVADNNLSAGTYTLTYSFKDAFGVSKSFSYTLSVQKKVLLVELSIPALFLAENEMPEPTLLSEVYSENELAQAVVEKYYRENGRYVWQTINENFTPSKSTYYQIKYVVSVNGIRKEFLFDKFIHKNANSIDFETETSAGKNMTRFNRSTKQGDVTDSRFLYDGGYWEYYGDENARYIWQVSNDWSVSGESSLTCLPYGADFVGFCIRPLMVTNGNKINAVSFWMKADATISGTHIELGYKAPKLEQPFVNSYIYSENFDVYAGAYYYTIFLPDGVTASDISLFGIIGQGNNRLYIDDLEFKYIERLRINEVDNPNAYNCNQSYRVQKPTLYSEFYSDKELASAKYELKYILKENTAKKVVPNQEGEYLINFEEKGNVKLVWTVSVNGFTKTLEDDIVVGIVDFATYTPKIATLNETLILDAPTSELPFSSVKVEYKHQTDNTWTELIANNEGKYQLLTDKQGFYDVHYKVETTFEDGTVIDGEILDKIYVYESGMLFSFEDEDAFRGTLSYLGNQGVSSAMTVEQKADGSHWIKVSPTMNAWDGFLFKKGSSYLFEEGAMVINSSKLLLSVYSEKEIENLQFEIWSITANNNLTATIDVKAGEHTYVLDFDGTIGEVFRFIFLLPYEKGITFYIDDLRIAPQLQEISYENISSVPSTITLQKPDFVSDWLSASDKASAKYELYYAVGDGKMQAVTEKDGVFVVTPTDICTITYEWRVSLFGITLMQKGSFEVGEIKIETPRTAKINQSILLPAPEAEFEISAVTIEYRHSSQTTWMEIVNDSLGYAFTPTQLGVYYVCYRVTSEYGLVERTNVLYSVLSGMLFSFEDEDAFRGTLSYLGNQGVSSAMTVEQKADGSHWVKVSPTIPAWEGFIFKKGSSYLFEEGAMVINSSKLLLTIYSEQEIKGLQFESRNSKWKDLTTIIDVKSGEHTYVLDFGETIGEIMHFIFLLPYEKQTTFYIDNLQLIPEIKTSTPRTAEINQSVMLTALEAELEIFSVTVEYRHSLQTDWTKLEKTSEKYSFTPTQEGIYFVRYQATSEFGVIEKTDVCYIDEKNVIFSFEEENAFRGTLSYLGNQGVSSAMTVEQKADGSHWVKVSPTMAAWDGFIFKKSSTHLHEKGAIVINSSKVSLTIYSEQEIKGLQFESWSITAQKYLSETVDVRAGEHIYILDFGEKMGEIANFNFLLPYEKGITFYIDDVRIIEE